MTPIWTIGHSDRSIETFLELLTARSIDTVADVRRFPGSRKYPHFNPAPLEASLRAAGIAYETFPELGGRRPPSPESPHTVWRHPAFRGYADYMDTPDFAAGLERLIALGAGSRTAVMCSEAVWWRCHRAMIADALRVRGITVLHIMGIDRTTEHPYTAPARVVAGRLHYGAAEE